MDRESDLGRENGAKGGRSRTFGQGKLLSVFVWIWVLGASTFFFLRFSFVFYGAYKSAIARLFSGVFGP